MSATTNERYDTQTILYHWTTAILVGVLWVIGQTVDFFPRGPIRGDFWSVHFLLGLLLILVLVVRLAWRFTAGRKLPDADSGWMRVLAKSAHHGLYLLLILACALGIANALTRGSHVFGLFVFPKLIDASMKETIGDLHEWSANILLFIALGHAAAALWHHFGVKDGVLRRMLPAA